MSVQEHWDLGQTADSNICMPLGSFKAAKDNYVDHLAIVACQLFGNTLAICPETRRKVQNTVLPAPPPIALRLLQIKVGHSAHDCANYFGTSQAGLQFLSFATALIATMGAVESSKGIHRLLSDYEFDEALLPTPEQVEKLMVNLESRCHLSSFGNELVGWHDQLCDKINDNENHVVWSGGLSTPTLWALDHIVCAFKELSGVGDRGTIEVTFSVSSITSWLAAFTNWYFGSPPSIYKQDGTPVMVTPGSKVCICVLPKSDSGEQQFEMTLHYSNDRPFSPLAISDRCRWSVMVDLRTYCKWLVRDLDCAKAGALMAAIRGSIGPAVKMAAANVSFSGWYSNDTQHLIPQNWRYPPERTQPWRETSKVLSLMFEDYDGDSADSYVTVGPEAVTLYEIPAVWAYIESARIGRGPSQVTVPQDIEASRVHFLKTLAQVVTKVLALSLYQHPESLKVFTRWDFPGTSSVVNLIAQALDGAKTSCPANALLDEALCLVGQTNGRDTDPAFAIMSSAYGQTVYFSFLETIDVVKRGYMSLSWLPGEIWFNKQRIRHHVRTPLGTLYDSSQFNYRQPDTEMAKTTRVNESVDLPAHLFPQWIGDWANGLALKVHGDEAFRRSKYVGVGGVLNSLAGSLFLEKCPDPPDMGLDEELEKVCHYLAPGDDQPIINGVDIYIFAVGWNDLYRFYSCAWLAGMPAVFGGDVCSNCCVKLCREAGLHFIIADFGH